MILPVGAIRFLVAALVVALACFSAWGLWLRLDLGEWR